MEFIDNRTVRTFQSFEEREAAFRELGGSSSLRRHHGPKVFFDDLKSSKAGEGQFLKDGKVRLCVTQNPRDWLAFRTVGEVLTAANAINELLSGEGREALFADAVNQFGLQNVMDVSVSRISYGEAAKVAMAKCYLLSQSASHCCIANPKAWLSNKSAKLLGTLQTEFTKNSVATVYLLLEGEDNQDSPKIDIPINPIDFKMRTKDLQVNLGSLIEDDEETETARISDFQSSFKSPLIVTGENGAGKSILANALCGLGIHSGKAEIETGFRVGAARMVFQDPIRQCLSRGFSQFKSYYKKEWPKIYEVYEHVIETSGNYSNQIFGSAASIGPIDEFKEPATLFQLRALLASIRIHESSRSSALILDEPAWGLSKQNAISLVAAIVTLSHQKGRPVIIISHNTWWDNLGKSWMKVEKSTDREFLLGSNEKFFTSLHECPDRKN